MNTKRAFWAGVLGGIVMTILFVIGNVLGLDVNPSLYLGTLFGLEPGIGAWVLGFFVHLGLSGLIGLAYAWGFERLNRPVTASVGVGFSLIHALIGGIVMGLMPTLHWLVPEVMVDPGFYMANIGPTGISGVIIFFVLHMVYGAIVGGMYRRVSVPRRREVILRERPA